VAVPPLDVAEILALRLFRGLDADCLLAADAHLRVEAHERGSVLFRQGDPGDALFVVLSGQVALEREYEAGRQMLALCGPDDWFGELGVLAYAPRTADATVVVAARLLRVDAAGWEALSLRAPRLFAHVCERLVRQLRASTEPPRRARRSLVACVESTTPWADGLAASIRCQFPARAVHLLRSAAGARGKLAERLSSIPEFDALVLLTGGEGASLAERTLERQSGTRWRLGSGVGGTTVNVIRGSDDATTLDRVARHLAGGTVGMALGAGGAYGYAHIGVLRALREASIPIDLVAGTSMGAIVGALLAAGVSVDAMAEFAAGAANRYGRIVLRDLDLRGSALLRGSEVRRVLAEIPGVATATFEDLDIPFVAIATDIDSGAEVLRCEGDLIDGIQPSFAMPGIFPPDRSGGRTLIDGAMVNPVPVDRVRAMGAGFVIAAQAIPPLAPTTRSPGLLRRVVDLVPGVRLGDTLEALDTTIRSFQALWRQHARASALIADAMLEPDLRAFGFLQFGAAAPIIEVGASHARRAVDDIRRRIAERIGLVLPT
jgi:NTE family protein